jgi:hypothetical protein
MDHTVHMLGATEHLREEIITISGVIKPAIISLERNDHKLWSVRRLLCRNKAERQLVGNESKNTEIPVTLQFLN